MDITSFGFTRFNRRQTAPLNREDNPDTTVEIPLSQTNQEIPDSSIDMTKLNPLSSGQTTYNSGIGFWLGVDDGTPKFSIGDSTGDGMTWDGVTFTITGGVSVSSLDIPDTTTANSFHTDTDGNSWWGTNVATGYATAPAKILKDGTATFSSITATGTINATAGYFTNSMTIGDGTTNGIITFNFTAAAGDSYIGAGKTDFTTATAGFILGIDDSDSDTAKIYLGDATNYLSWDGSTLSIAGTTLLNSTLDEVTNARVSTKTMMPIERMIQTSPGASSDNGSYFQITTAAANNSMAEFSQSCISTTFVALEVHDKNPEFWVPVKWNFATAQEGFIGYVDATFGGTSLEDHIMTLEHFGFIVEDGTLYASNADGSTQTVTDISAGITITTGHAYWATFDGTTILFYVDGVLKATHTTNVPAGNLDKFSIAAIADVSGNAKIVAAIVTGRFAWDKT